MTTLVLLRRQDYCLGGCACVESKKGLSSYMPLVAASPSAGAAAACEGLVFAVGGAGVRGLGRP